MRQFYCKLQIPIELLKFRFASFDNNKLEIQQK